MSHLSRKPPPCALFPYERSDVLFIQEVSQTRGWMIDLFEIPVAWAKTMGDGVKVAVVDTGCDLDHPDLVHNLLPGLNVLDPSRPPDDDNAHGTHVAGIVAAENNGIGMVGVAPKCKVIPIKVLDASGNGNLSDVAKGIQAAMDLGADIITMSLGSPSPMPSLQRVLQLAERRGVPVFVAAGNAGRTADVYFPSAYPETISIGAIDSGFRRATFSNTGLNLDFMAPGVDIMSTVPNNWYALMSGSSMATPFVAGVAALLLSAARLHGVPLPDPEAYREKFRQHCFPITDEGAGDQFYQGYGIISVKDLIE